MQANALLLTKCLYVRILEPSEILLSNQPALRDTAVCSRPHTTALMLKMQTGYIWFRTDGFQCLISHVELPVEPTLHGELDALQ